ncbi:MAG: helix-turn-helix transcriptional regulator [Bacillota bacterium]|nr:helix-turn-helix transcriptional regulator [Bacillota bacterium]
MNKIGQRIKQLRKENKITQEELGKMFGMVKSTISLYENGKSNPDDEIKQKIADQFNVSIDWLLGRTDERRTADEIIAEYKEKELEFEELFDRFNIYFEGRKLTEKDKKSIISFLQMLRERESSL